MGKVGSKDSRVKRLPKPIDLIISIHLPGDHKAVKASITPDGEVVFVDKDGNEVIPETANRTVQYSRHKGPKIQSRSNVIGDRVSVGGLKEFIKFDSVFVEDTNTISVKGEKISAACFLCCRFVLQGDDIRIECEGKVNIYELHNVPGNAEMLAVLKVAHDIIRSAGKGMLSKIAFISDSELGSHEEINERKTQLYGEHYLPSGFSLHYASSDTGQEALNRLIKFCDKQSSEYLQKYSAGELEKTELKPLEEDSSVQYRYMYRDGLEIINPIVKGISLRPGSTVSLYGLKKRKK